jgi:Heterokaryon incompatibility protein (HET)
LKLAQYWIKQCTSELHPRCPNKDFRDPPKLNHSLSFFYEKKYSKNLSQCGKLLPQHSQHSQKHAYYPSRLIDLRSHHLVDEISGKLLDETKVQLVETKSHQLQGDQEGYYVTLSHRWGNNLFTQLRKENFNKFKESILVKSLPQTFQDAIHFARRLAEDKDIRYLWIDSLCILQNDKDDWDRESVQMHQVYSNSYCNLSATAATDCDPGLYFKRDRHHLWENEINLNIEGLRGARDTRFGLLGTARAESEGKKLCKIAQSSIRRCIVRDVSFWSGNVEDAPVNERAWVLQERLLSPRVLHFVEVR